MRHRYGLWTPVLFLSVLSIGGNRFANQFFKGIGLLVIFGIVIAILSSVF